MTMKRRVGLALGVAYLVHAVSAAEGPTLPTARRADDQAVSSGIEPDDRGRRGREARAVTRAQMVEEIHAAWNRPTVVAEAPPLAGVPPESHLPLLRRLQAIILPEVSFNQVELQRVAQSLSALAAELEGAEPGLPGVNIVLLDPTSRNPSVTLALRNLSLQRVLDFVVESVGYQYEVQGDAVVIRPGGERSLLDTAFFPVARSTVVRMTAFAGEAGRAVRGESGPADVGGSVDQGAPLGSGASGAGAESAQLRLFLQSAGVAFDSVPGASLAYDGSAMIVTQTPRNLERIRTILNRYTDVRQVEIEAKFVEVTEGVLDELGITWSALRDGGVAGGGGSRARAGTGRVTRSVVDTFGGGGASNAIVIDGEAVASTRAPELPGAVPLGADAAAIAEVAGVVGGVDVNALVRLLAQKAGGDLLSAPRVTVLSGHTATITVAQEMRYPQSFGEIQSQVGAGRTAGESAGGGSAGVTITAGTPQDFTSRNVGVELKVTPTVEEDDYSISLDLAPKVTEFEGFVEFGGPSVAVSGGRTVTVPPGFYQPIFSVREVSTKVSLWDGATLVMGGLTREEVKKVEDKVPILGDVPLLGRLFRSRGESSQKRNLLIFVTANLVSPGGSPKKQVIGDLPPGALFRGPTLVTPGGSVSRHVDGPASAGR
jgi:general secretion pathway protein D